MAVVSAFVSSSQGSPLSETSFLRLNSHARTTVCSKIPMSDAMASPATSKCRNIAAYMGSDAITINVLATIGVSVSPAA